MGQSKRCRRSSASHICRKRLHAEPLITSLNLGTIYASQTNDLRRGTLDRRRGTAPLIHADERNLGYHCGADPTRRCVHRKRARALRSFVARSARVSDRAFAPTARAVRLRTRAVTSKGSRSSSHLEIAPNRKLPRRKFDCEATARRRISEDRRRARIAEVRAS